jgi:uncharacterized membrane protein YphA (DoxX/SURF4 family)
MADLKALAKSILFWTLCIVIGLLFIYLGAKKIFWQPKHFFGYPLAFRFFVGAAEMSGGALLFIPRARAYGAIVISVVMLGALATHLRYGQWRFVPIPVMFLTLTGIIIWHHKPPFLQRLFPEPEEEEEDEEDD